MTGEQRAAVAAAGYMAWALDFSGRTLLSPDGARLVTPEQALAEIEEDHE